MAEFVGVIGSAVGILSFGLTISQGLIKYYSTWKDNGNDISKMLSSMESLTKTFELLKDILIRGDFPESQVKNVSDWIEKCEESVVELAVDLKRLTVEHAGEDMEGVKSSRQKLKEKGKKFLWPFRESTILKLLENIVFIRGNLKMAMQGLHLSTVPALQEKLDSISKGVDHLVMEHKDEKNNKMLKWLSNLEFNLKQEENLSKRESGTGLWLFETQEYQDWIEGKNNVLWGYGGPGVGKTILASAVIYDIQTRIRGKNSAVVFAYFDHAQKASQTVGEILGSFSQQLIRKHHELPRKLPDLYNEHIMLQTRPHISDFRSLLKAATIPLEKVYIVIDALDECVISNKLVTELKNLSHNVYIFYTSRYVNYECSELKKQFNQALQIRIKGIDADVRKYLKTQIQTEDNLIRLCGQHPDLSENIVDKIVKKTDGMFLLASFHIKSLAEQLNVKKLLKALTTLPERLNETYDITMDRICKGQGQARRTLAMQILLWVVYATKPLTVKELQHALAAMELEQEDNMIDDNDLYSKYLMVAVCAGLVFIDEKDAIRLVHYSAQEYLLQNQEVLFPLAERKIRKTCMKYLLMESFFEFEPGNEAGDFREEEEQYKALSVAFPLLHYSCQLWWEILSSRGKMKSFAGEVLYFVDDKRSRGLTLVVSDSLFFPPGDTLLEEFTQSRRRERLLLLADCFSINPLGNLTALLKSAIFNLPKLTSLLLKNGYNVDEHGVRGTTALHIAAFTGCTDVLEKLLKKNARVNALCDNNWGDRWSPLHLASAQGHFHIANKLLRVGAYVNAEDSELRTPLIVTARWTYYSEFLAENKSQLAAAIALKGAKANLGAVDSKGQNALFWPTSNALRGFLLGEGVEQWENVTQIIGYPIFIDQYIEHILLIVQEGRILPQDKEGMAWLQTLIEAAEYPTIPRVPKYSNQSTRKDIFLSIPEAYLPGFPQNLRETLEAEFSLARYLGKDPSPRRIIVRQNGTAMLLREHN